MNGKIPTIPVGDADNHETPDFGEAAADLFGAGWMPIPTKPGTKIPAVKWEPWKKNLSRRKIRRYFKKHPEDELAVILGPDIIVLDADTDEGVIALYMLEKWQDITPNLVVETARGEHHYFRLKLGTFAKSDAPDKTDHPDRVDIKTGNAIAMVPPSTGKQYGVNEAESSADLVAIDQAAVDAVFRHNGREAPRSPPDIKTAGPDTVQELSPLTTKIDNLLVHIDPDSGYDDWARVGMALHAAFGGSEAGLAVFDEWSGRGEKYPGHAELVKKWRSFDGYSGNPVKLGTLYRLALQSGATLDAIGEEFFEVIIDDDTAAASLPEHSLVPYSLRGKSGEFEAEMLEHTFVLGRIAILSQWTVIYAPPNYGKTLLTLWMIIQSIKGGNLDPEDLFYINADDNHPGLTSKLKIAEEHGFHMLAPGYEDFRGKNFLALLRRLCKSGRAHGTIVILDTLKKFTDLMDKRTASDFGNAIREFIAKGGTLIGLAHVNKKRDPDGKPIYAGTTDIVDDADCAYVLDSINEEGDLRTVEFENIKSRGMVAKRAAYRYSTAEGLGYLDLLASVSSVEESEAEALRDAAAHFDEQELPVIQAVSECIARGYTAKTKLIAKVTDLAGCSRRDAERVIDKFTGDDPTTHHWRFTRGARGLMTFELLPEPVDGETMDLDQEIAELREGTDDLGDEEVY